MQVQDNSRLYAKSPLDRTKDQLAFGVFPVEVLTVDYERRALTVQDMRDQSIYSEVTIFPANYSSFTASDVSMPEPGAIGLCCNWVYEAGFRKLAIISWIVSGVAPAVDAIAQRAIEGDEIQGWTDRIRGTYRKAYPGPKTSTLTGGYTERLDIGW